MKRKNLIKSLLGRPDPAIENLNCPNCWGRQEYEGQYCEVRITKKIDLNNVEEHLGWITAYVMENFDGVHPSGKIA